MDNYDFCAKWAIGQGVSNSMRILDYGCGAGEIVRMLRARGLDAYGTDVFYEGGDYSQYVDSSLLGAAIRRMDGSAIPFDDNYFDVVINNQVLEHVPYLDDVLQEIERVLKPGGKCLSLFPDKGVWREGHCGVPLLHWFPKHSQSRVYYAAALRLLGLGYHTDGKGIMRWSKDFCDWLDKWTFYRELGVIEAAYAKTFAEVHHIEDTWLRMRLDGHAGLIANAPVAVQRWLVRKLTGLVIVSVKAGSPDHSPQSNAAEPT